MKILLIHPKMTHGTVTYEDRGTFREILFTNPETTLPAVAASIPSGNEIRILHESFEDIDYSIKYDLVGITCFTLFALQAYEIADNFRNLGIPVVLGGHHPSALPKEAEQHADSVVIGEAEYIFPVLLKDLKRGKLKTFYKSNKPVKAEDIPALRRNLMRIPTLSQGIKITRGCPYKCSFCSITYFFNHNYRKRPIPDVIKEIKSLPNKYMYIHDANLTVDLEYSKDLFRTMIKEKVNKTWSGNGNIYMLGKDEEFLDLARKSGCLSWTIGFESIMQKSLNGVNKNENRVRNYSKWIKKIKKYGMGIFGLFIFGFDYDTPDIFDATIEALDHLKIDAAEFNILTPLPGTPLFEKMKKEDRILTYDWSKYSQTEVVFQPKNMDPGELYNGTRKVAKDFYSYRKMIKRFAKIPLFSCSSSTFTNLFATNISRYLWYKRDFSI